MAAFKCNHDIQVLLGGKDIADRIHYCTKYVTKQQKRLDSVVVIALAALRRRQEREAMDTPISHNSLAIARKRVASMVYTMTNRQEIAGPLAALYLHRGSCCYESSSCVFVPLRDIVQQLCSTDNYSCQLVSDGDGVDSARYHPVSFLDDYMYRPDNLNGVNLYEFAMIYFRKQNTGRRPPLLTFKAAHPLHCSHSLGKRYQEVVPVIQGVRLPYIYEQSPDEIRYRHAILSLILFKPFQDLADLTDSTDSSDAQWLHAFNEWAPTRTYFVKMIMDHISDYHCGAEQTSSRVDTALTGDTDAVGDDEYGNDNGSDTDSLFGAAEFDGSNDDLEEPGDDSTDDFINPWLDSNDESNVVLDSQSLHPAEFPTAAMPNTRIDRILNVFKVHNMLAGSSQSTVAHQQRALRPSNFPDIDGMRKWVKSAATDCNFRDASSLGEARLCNTRVVEILADALAEDSMTWNAPPVEISSRRANNYSTIADVSRDFTLNEKQHYAFKLIGRALLNRWKHVEDASYLNCNVDETLEKDQLRMFLGGEGGTGKSRVLDAVQALCTSWQRPDCIVKTALTGKAATVISGRTLASLIMQLRRKQDAAAAACVDILVVDEVSMMRKTQLAQLDKLLRAAKRVRGVGFGGVHVILVGDFLLLPPVGGEPLFKDPWTGRRRPTPNELAGYQLWQTFTDVIVLEESVRFRGDSEWGRGCKYAREGVWLPEFVEIINSRVVGQAQTVFNEWCPGKTVPTFITPDNTTRLSITNLFISTAAKLLPDGEYPVRVVANFQGKLSKLGISEVKEVMAMPDSKFGRMAPYLDLVVGMPVQLTQNVRAEKMAVNGTHGTLETILFSPDTTFCIVHDSVANVTVKVPSIPPPAVIVRFLEGRQQNSC